MATIITKNSATPSQAPSSLTQGELAINVTDGKLYYGSGSSNVVKEFTGSGGSGSPTFPYTGSAIISGSLTITGSFFVSNSIDSVNRSTQDSSGNESINWDARRLSDENGQVSLYYDSSRTLNSTDGNPILDWNQPEILKMTGHLIPGGTITDNTSSYDLGSATAAWRDLYVSNGSINLISGSQSASISFTNGALDFGTTPISSPDVIATASVSSNTITFTKGDGSTFPITVDTGSGGGASKIANFIQSADGTTVTGTTNNTLSSTILIPANTIAVGDAITLKVRAVKVGTAGTSRVFTYINTAGTIAGGGLIATGPAAAAANIYHQVSREFVIQSSTVTQGFPSATALITDDVNTSVTITNSNIDWTVNQYFVFSLTNGSAADSTRTTYARVTIMKP